MVSYYPCGSDGMPNAYIYHLPYPSNRKQNSDDTAEKSKVIVPIPGKDVAGIYHPVSSKDVSKRRRGSFVVFEEIPFS